MKDLQKMHNAIKAVEEKYDEQTNRFYFHGGRKPLPLEIQVRRKLKTFVREYGKDIVKAYWKCCWWRGLSLPSKEMVERYLKTGKVKGELYGNVPDEIFMTENGEKVLCRFTGYEVLCGNDPLKGNWFKEYTDSEGNLYYSEAY